MEATIVTLASGNQAVFFNYSGLRHFFVTNNNITQFLGGGLGLEAERKERIFTNFSNSVVETTNSFEVDNMYNLRHSAFASKLGSASAIFTRAYNDKIIVSDLVDCDGTGSNARTCDERARYYRAVGLGQLYNSVRSFHLVLFIANHVTIFGCDNFRETFFHSNNEQFESDSYLMNSQYLTRYNKARIAFKAPAYYVRSLVISKTN